MTALTDALVSPDGIPTPQRYWAILAIALAITLAVLDSAIANIALPTIARELNASAAASIWIVNSYQLAVVVSLLPLAALGEIVGYRRVYQTGVALFTVASLGCALSRSLDSLAIARIIQGFGAAGIMSINAALMRFIYPRDQLGRAFGFFGAVVAVSSAIGPTVASAILAIGSWPWLFGVNVPIGVAAFTLAYFALPRTPTVDRAFNWLGAALNAAAFGFLISGVDLWGRGFDLAGGVEMMAGLAAATALVITELPRSAPLMPFDLLRIPNIGLSALVSICSFAAQMLAFVSLPFYFQSALGHSAVETGLLMTPWPVAVGLVAPIAGRLADRWTASHLGALGLGLLTVSLILLILLPANPAALDIGWRVVLCGAGFSLFLTPNSRAIMISAPHARSGAASGLTASARLIGQTAGTAMVAVIFRSQFHEASHVPLIAAAILSTIGAGLCLMRVVDKGSNASL